MGFVSGLGAVTADVLYGFITGIGLTIVTNFLIGQQDWLRLIGGLFLCYLGIKIFANSSESKRWQSFDSLCVQFFTNNYESRHDFSVPCYLFRTRNGNESYDVTRLASSHRRLCRFSIMVATT